MKKTLYEVLRETSKKKVWIVYKSEKDDKGIEYAIEDVSANNNMNALVVKQWIEPQDCLCIELLD